MDFPHYCDKCDHEAEADHMANEAEGHEQSDPR